MNLDLYGWVAFILFSIASVPQLVRTYKLKDVDDLSPTMWWLLWGAHFSLYLYGTYLLSIPIILNGICGFFSASLMLILIYLYKDPYKDENRKIIRRLIKDAQKKFKT